MNLFCRLTETNFPRRDQSQTLIEVNLVMQESSKSRRSRVSAGFLAFVSPFIAAVIAFSLARARSISALHRWAFRLILVYAIEVSRWTPSGLHGLRIITHEMQRFLHLTRTLEPLSSLKALCFGAKGRQVRDLCWSCLPSEDRKCRLV